MRGEKRGGLNGRGSERDRVECVCCRAWHGIQQLCEKEKNALSTSNVIQVSATWMPIPLIQGCLANLPFLKREEGGSGG